MFQAPARRPHESHRQLLSLSRHWRGTDEIRKRMSGRQSPIRCARKSESTPSVTSMLFLEERANLFDARHQVPESRVREGRIEVGEGAVLEVYPPEKTGEGLLQSFRAAAEM